MAFLHLGSSDSAPANVRLRALIRASILAVIADLALIGLKYTMGRVFGIFLLYADALHSGGDLVLSLLVLCAVVMNHVFRQNTLARRAEGIVSFIIAILILFGSAEIMMQVFMRQPAEFTLQAGTKLFAAFVGISIGLMITLAMSHYKRTIGKTYDSSVFLAEGSHTYTDFLTSLAVWFTLLLGFFGINIQRAITLIVGLSVLRIGVSLCLRSAGSLGLRIRIPAQYRDSMPGAVHSAVNMIKRLFMLLDTLTRRLEQMIPILKEGWVLKHKKDFLLGLTGIIAVVYVCSGFYLVLPHQSAIEQVFGRVAAIQESGLHYTLPRPFSRVVVVDSHLTNRVECGFRTNLDENAYEPLAYLWEYSHTEGRFSKISNEADVLTGDENIIDANFFCYYTVSDPVQYALRCNEAHEIVRSLLVHAVHTELANFTLDNLLTVDRAKIQVLVLDNLRESLRRIPLGVEILTVAMREAHPPIEVVPEYRAVSSARERSEEIIHEAHAFANDLVPRSRGNAAVILSESEAWSEETVMTAKGQTSSFTMKQNHFRDAEGPHRTNLWWSALEQSISWKTVYIVPKTANVRMLSPGMEVQ